MNVGLFVAICKCLVSEGGYDNSEWQEMDGLIYPTR